MANIDDLRLAADAIEQFERQGQVLAKAIRAASRVSELHDAAYGAGRVHCQMIEDAHRVLKNQIALARPPELQLGIAEAMARASELWGSNETIGLLTRDAQRMIADWEAMTLTPEVIANLRLPTFVGKIPEILGIAALTEAKLAMLRFEDIGRAIGLDQTAQRSLVADAAELTRTFGELYRGTTWAKIEQGSVARAATRLPTVEVFNNTDLLELISPQDDASLIAEGVVIARADIAEETFDILRQLLRRLDPALVQLADGADAAFDQQAPDWVRHCTTSLRELFTQVLHRLAPDNEIRGWTESPEDFDKGRPTRNARLRYICRKVSAGAFVKFIEADIKAAGECVQLFQHGTHGVSVPFTALQVRAMKARMEGVVRLLLEIGLND